MIANDLARWRMGRGKRGVSKAHLARSVNVSRSYITKLENGTLQPGAEVMFRIARFFDCKVDDIFKYIENED